MGKPHFSTAWGVSQRIYDPANSGKKVADIVGGNVALNINSPDKKVRWTNTCAVRLSYILNYSGTNIPRTLGQTVSGADKRWYFYRVKNLISFLQLRWGEAEVVQFPPSDGGALKGRRGLILFEITGWSDAQGHATLFDGSSCYDSCYFNEPGVHYRTDRAHFWSLT